MRENYCLCVNLLYVLHQEDIQNPLPRYNNNNSNNNNVYYIVH